MRKLCLGGTVLCMLCVALAGRVHAGEELQIPADEYRQRRQAVLQQMPPHSVAIFHAAFPKRRSADTDFEYRQSSNLLYLTGFTEPNAALILVKGDTGAVPAEEIAFVPKPNARLQKIQGAQLRAGDARLISGVQQVQSYEQFEHMCTKLLARAKVLFYDFPVGFVYEPVSGERYFVEQKAKRRLRETFAGLKIKSTASLLSGLRQIKSERELAIMQRAIDITGMAQVAAMQSARPGMHEYELEATIEYMFKKHGAGYPAFPSIVGSGPNATVLHYWKNNRRMRSGELVVMDIGAEVQGYSADITRTIPVNGKFSDKQREIYRIVLEAQKAALAQVKPGATLKQVHAAAKNVIRSHGFGAFFTHGTSHYLGLDTHDVGKHGPLQPGMVITVEPGIYIPEGSDVDESYWNIGVRIEDDVLVTATGHRVLSAKVPRTIPEIEAAMKNKSFSVN